jgi:hypothetical protein
MRTMLGTYLPELGFAVICAPQLDDVWFPVSFATEFKVRVLLVFERETLVGCAK